MVRVDLFVYNVAKNNRCKSQKSFRKPNYTTYPLPLFYNDTLTFK